MIRAIRWLWLVLPRGWVVALFLVFYAVHESLWLLVSSGRETGDAADQLWVQRNLLVAGACAAYGIFRAVASHPLFRPEYCKWLELTPWTSRKPLPAGPIHWVPQDAVILGIFVALLHTWNPVVLQVLAAFAIGYQEALAISLWPTGLRWRCYTILFVLGAAVWMIQNPPVALAVAVVAYPFTYLSLLRCLERFPWQLPEWWPKFQLKPNATREDRKAIQKGLGWPYDVLQPVRSKIGIDFSDGAAVSLLLGWWVYAIADNVPADKQDGVYGAALMAVGYSALSRLVLYCSNHRWPISLRGRLATWRWIIPRYDQILVAPVLAVLIQVLGLPCLLQLAHVDVAAAIALSVALTASVLLNMGPTLADWQLTGGHRIVPGFTNKCEFVQL